MKNTPPALREAVTRLTRLPRTLRPSDLEVVLWDRQSDINGTPPAEVVAAWTDDVGAPCPDACAVLIRERASGLVFVLQYRNPITGAALQDPAHVAAAILWLRKEKLESVIEMDVAGPAMALISAASKAAGLSPTDAMASLAAIFGQGRAYAGPDSVPLADPSAAASGPISAAAAAAIAGRRPLPVADDLALVDQPPPSKGYGDMWRSLIDRLTARGQIDEETAALMEERRHLGIERYGTPLQAGNGRLAVVDLLQELLDALVYTEQVAEERPELVREIRGEWQTSLILLLERVRRS